MAQTRWPLSILATAALVAAAGAAVAQEPADCPLHGGGHDDSSTGHHAAAGDAPHAVSPYVDLQSREIAALGEDQTRQRLAGEGMGMALPAELHGFPCPKHVLDLADDMGLSAEQRRLVEASLDAMHRKAVELARLRGELRDSHLAAHLDMARVLTPDQQQRYATLRGCSRPQSYAPRTDDPVE